MKEEEQIIEIIQKKLDGKLTQEETNKLNKWLENPLNVDAYAQYKQVLETTTNISVKQEQFYTNSDKAWQAIEQHIVSNEPKRRFKLSYALAASVALICMVLGANYLFNTSDSHDNVQYVLQSNEKDTITFSDGSQAYLFGPCSMNYPQEFDQNKRIITMDGLAYFDIARDETRPFEINTKQGKVEVLGTSFTVDTRKDKVFTVQCISGKVRMTAFEGNNEYNAVLTKNLKATYNNGSNVLEATLFDPTDVSIKIPVRNMTFNNKPLGEILEQIENRFDVTIQLENERLLETKYSTTLNDSTLDDFLNELRVTFKVDIIQTKKATYILK